MLILDKLKELKTEKRNCNRFSKFKHINNERADILTGVLVVFGLLIIPRGVFSGYEIESLFLFILLFFGCFNKYMKRLRYLNKLQLKYYDEIYITMERFNINENYEIYYQEMLTLNEEDRINEIPSEVVEEIISVYKKNKKEKISSEEMINRSIELDNENYIEITNE